MCVEERENTALTEREGEREKRKDREMRERKKREREREKRNRLRERKRKPRKRKRDTTTRTIQMFSLSPIYILKATALGYCSQSILSIALIWSIK